MGERMKQRRGSHTSTIQDEPELIGRGGPILQLRIRPAAQVRRPQLPLRYVVIRPDCVKLLDRPRRLAAAKRNQRLDDRPMHAPHEGRLGKPFGQFLQQVVGAQGGAA